VSPRRAGFLFPLLLAACLFGMAGAAERPALLFPPDLALIPDAKVKLFAYRPPGGAADNLLVNGVSSNPWEGEMFLKGEVELAPGLNLIQAFGQTVRLFVLQNARMERFRLPGAKEGEELVFQRYGLHPALDDGCDGCHVATGGKLTAKNQLEACYACHGDFSKEEEGKKPYVHSPVRSGECTSCHDPHFSARPKLYKVEKGCLECHDPFPSTGTVHRPVANGECLSCHSPHASTAPMQLRRWGNALCLGCHADTHEIHRTAEVRGRITQVPEDFPREKGNLSCFGCHAPHQTPERKLFVKERTELCKTCHRF